MKKLLFFCNSLQHGGGIEKIFHTLEKDLSSNFLTQVLTLEDGPDRFEIVGDYNSFDEKNKNSNPLSKAFRLTVRTIKLISFLRKNNIDIIICAQEHLNLSAIIAKRFNRRLKVYCTVHTDPLMYKDDRAMSFLIRKLYPKANKVLTTSKEQEFYFNKYWGISNTMTIYNPVELPPAKGFGEVFPQDLYDTGDFVFFTIGRLSKQKNQKYLLESFLKVNLKYPKTKLIIAGDGELRGEVEKIIKDNGLERSVHLLGNTKGVLPFLEKSDCFVLSSLWEGLPVVIVESLMVGIPIISTDYRTGVRESLAPSLPFETNIPNGQHHLGERGIITNDLEHTMCSVVEAPSLLKKYKNVYTGNDWDREEVVKKWLKLLS